eukprot:CAMPEP_0117422534 /NCGR_PEP_ID=MMETSP0758-20121206/3349_1 /TAXON_ID=63605 /ORGANISM="Percolomonas cosmopolitus, Strain AE-1 (ATCC 50343)" /LENGTH=158 /DNA_ID=CAMNT_0005205201 /DNA_START=433 /DNA_END=906 /DNA_ORIENTATION=+
MGLYMSKKWIQPATNIEKSKIDAEIDLVNWNLNINIIVLADGGNLFDALAEAMVKSLNQLMETGLPNVVRRHPEQQGRIMYGDSNSSGIYTMEANNMGIQTTLHALSFPKIMTWALIGNDWVLDPTKEEENISTNFVTLYGDHQRIHTDCHGGQLMFD